MNKLKRLLWLIPALLLLAAAAFVVWATTGSTPMPEALASLASDSEVEVNTDDWLVFRPKNQTPETGLIFYPGGRVDPQAYAPAARDIAAEGYLVVIPPMPLNLAVFSPSKAEEIIEAFPEIELWAIGGHSLGGAMAAGFAANNPDDVQGLVLWAAYPAGGDDLSAQDIHVLSAYGTNDGLTTLADVDNSRQLLPSTTEWLAIEGGNHAQFGWYGEQSGDIPADISRSRQQEQLVQGTVELLAGLGERQ